MSSHTRLRRTLALGASAAAMIMAAPALAQQATAPTSAGPSQGGLGPAGAAPSANNSAVPPTNGQAAIPTGPAANGATGVGANAIQELVVTAERREESIQNAPVAVSAFSADALKAQRLDGGENLVLSVPNVNYSRGNFGGYNFQIRGIGTKVVSNTGDPGVSFNVNTLPVAANHLGDTDFYDVERVEVLRGPQGTLYGRTATGGAVNVITAKPTDRFGGSITTEFGNFDDKKVTGFLNVPVNDFFQFRVAGFFLDRDGYGNNGFTGNSVDGRNLNSFRFTGQFKFNDRLKATLYFEDYNEKDDRNRVGKQLCIKDPGPASVGGVPTNTVNRGFLSQGCATGSLYQDAAYGTVNSQGTFGGIFNTLVGLSNQDILGNHPLQNHNLHDIESVIDPIYEAKERLHILEVDYDLTDNLHLSSITGYNRNTGYSVEDYTRVVASTPFGATPAAGNAFTPALGAAYTGLYQSLFPGGVVKDPQLGGSNRDLNFDYGNTASDEVTEEVRVSSSFKGPLNFSAGGIYIASQNLGNYYVFFNPINAYLQVNNALYAGVPSKQYFIDNKVIPDATGHNYFDSRYGNNLWSYAGFGEAYWTPVDDIKVTAGFRYTVDNKKGIFYSPLLFVPGSAPSTLTRPRASFKEPSARFNVEWTPHFSFTDRSLIYGTYSHGYKSGGFNTPPQGVDFTSGSSPYPLVYNPELVDAFEVGSKNTLMGGSLILNLTGFYYDYQGYQISAIVNKSSVNSNINAEIFGGELESIYQPVHNLTLNANIGYLHTKVKDAVQLDQANLTQGDPSLTVVKAQDGSNCVVNTAGLANLLAINEGLPGAPNIPGITGNSSALLGACSGAFPAALGLYTYGSNVQTLATNGQNVGLGVLRNLEGNDLPNSPQFTVSLGAQYVVDLPSDWKATIRGDYYWQDDSYARIYNAVNDRLQSYENVNATLSFDNPRLGLNLQLFVKNLTNSQPFTDFYLTDASSGLFTNTFTLDPRTYGVSLTKRF